MNDKDPVVSTFVQVRPKLDEIMFNLVHSYVQHTKDFAQANKTDDPSADYSEILDIIEDELKMSAGRVTDKLRKDMQKLHGL